MRVLLAVCTFTTVLAGPAQADLCRDIETIKAGTGEATMTLPHTGHATTCTRSLVLGGGNQAHCGWAFAYRAGAAGRAFKHLVDAVAACLGDGASVVADRQVNHPDSYDLRTFRQGGQEVAVSLKDKATLAQTYVFLRITLAN